MTSGNDQPPDRRPIASRKHAVWIAASRLLARRGVSANAISIFGMIAGIAAGLAFFFSSHRPELTRAHFVLGAALVQFRLICNMLDGMVALERGTPSSVGELYNEIPDRVSDMATIIGFGYAVNSLPVLGYLGAALAVFVAYVRAAAKVAGAPQDYRGPMAKQQRMFTITLAAIFCGFAPVSWQPTIAAQGWSVPAAALALICIGCLITALRRIFRAASILKNRPS